MEGHPGCCTHLAGPLLTAEWRVLMPMDHRCLVILKGTWVASSLGQLYIQFYKYPYTEVCVDLVFCSLRCTPRSGNAEWQSKGAFSSIGNHPPVPKGGCSFLLDAALPPVTYLPLTSAILVGMEWSSPPRHVLMRPLEGFWVEERQDQVCVCEAGSRGPCVCIHLGDKTHTPGRPEDTGLRESEWGFRHVAGAITEINYQRNNK